MSGFERRSSQRLVLRAQAEVQFSSWNVFRLIYTVNISQGGMMFELDHEPAMGTQLLIKLGLPSGPPVELNAVVRHSTLIKREVAGPGSQKSMTRYHVGVQFQNLDAQKKALIEGRIEAATPGAGPIQPAKK